MKSIVQIKVRNYHLDRFGHVNNARYLEFLEEGRWAYSEENHLIESFDQGGIKHAAVNINIDYRKSATDGDLLFVKTKIEKRSDKSITFRQKIFIQDTKELVAEASVTNVYLDAEGDVLETEVLERFWPDIRP